MTEFYAAGKRFPLNRTYVMGILNVTPDSFSDGGKYFDPEKAVRHAVEMEAQGVDIVDIGGGVRRLAWITDLADRYFFFAAGRLAAQWSAAEFAALVASVAFFVADFIPSTTDWIYSSDTLTLLLNISTPIVHSPLNEVHSGSSDIFFFIISL